ncbi:MAG: hypothetical protein Q9218_004557 [Villophora microphyllina]
MPRQYQYRPLGHREIRVVQFRHCGDTHDLSCEFRVGTADGLRNTYTAISYCWGQPDRVSELSCPGDQSIRITHAVGEIAHWLVGRGLEQYYWIDFLCINQDDLDEKAEQVALMGTIFSYSQKVEAWLGRDVEDGEAAYKFLIGIATVYVGFATNAASQTQFPTEWWPEFPPSDFARCKGLFQRPWFTRLWVIQEFAMAPEIRKGCNNSDDEGLSLCYDDFTIPWLAFLWLSHLTHHHAIDLELLGVDTETYTAIANMTSMNRMRIRYRLLDKPLTLAQGLGESLQFQTSDPRDRIYAINGLCLNLNVGGIPLDYKASVNDVYYETAYALIAGNKAVDVLAVAGVGYVDNELPSWVPDWRRDPSLTGAIALYHQGWETCRASGTLVPHVQGDWNAKSLTISAVHVDTYDRDFPFPQPQPRPGLVQRFIGPSARLWVNEIRDFLKGAVQCIYSEEEPRDLILARTLTAHVPGVDVNNQELLDGLDIWLRLNDVADDLGTGEWKSPSKDHFIMTILEGLKHLATSKIFGSQGRRLLGFGPKSAREGDMICILIGLSIPCLLRPNESKRGTWKFVGVCYVDGLMYGEGLKIRPREEFILV